MTSPQLLLADRHDVVRAAGEMLTGYGDLAFQAPPSELGGLLGDLAEVGAKITAAMVQLIGCAESTGVIQESQCPSTRARVADNAWHAREQASTLARTAAVWHRPDLQPLASAIRSLDVSPAVAATIRQEFDKTIGALRPGCDVDVLDIFIDAGAEFGSSQVRRLREEVISRFAEPGRFQDEQDRCKRQVQLSAGRETADGVFQYELTLDPESRALMEAALGPLSSPRPGPDGELDTRSNLRRRGEALIEVLRKGVQSAAGIPGAGVKAALTLTMALDDLVRRTGAGKVLGSRASDTLIGPDTVRKIACDAAIIPAVLGSDGEVVDLGRQVRLFTPGTGESVVGQGQTLFLRRL